MNITWEDLIISLNRLPKEELKRPVLIKVGTELKETSKLLTAWVDDDSPLFLEVK